MSEPLAVIVIRRRPRWRQLAVGLALMVIAASLELRERARRKAGEVTT